MVKAGTSVIYITHRLAEIRQIGHRVTVLRDGRVRGSGLVAQVTDEALLNMIVGRELGSTFPPKATGGGGDVNFSVRSLTGRQFHDVSFEAARGEIVGVAGVAGNGQSELLRALAGLEPSVGAVEIGGRILDAERPPAESRLHAVGPSRRGTGRRALRARECVDVGARGVRFVRGR